MINEKFLEWTYQNAMANFPISDGKDMEPVSIRELSTPGYLPTLNQDPNFEPVCEDYNIVGKRLMGVDGPS